MKLLELEGRVDSVGTILHRKICTTRALGQPAQNLSHSWLYPARKINIQSGAQ